MKILLKISFLGTAYCGWQAQENGNSVQQRLTAAAKSLFGFDCDITGCSRTDSGVHAAGFCATVSRRSESGLETSVPLDRIARAMNTFLPEDISVVSSTEVPDDFHARYSVKSKEYIYRIFTRPERDPFLSGLVWHCPRQLDAEKMNRAAECFAGRHDFSAFMAQGSKIVDTVRTVYYADVTDDGDLIEYRVSADGFLYNMVRIMAGTLVEVGEGKIEPERITEIIAGKNRSAAGVTAPACGLYLNRVIY